MTIPRVTKTATVRDAIEPIYPGRQPFHGVTEVHVSYVESEQSAGDYTAWCTYMLKAARTSQGELVLWRTVDLTATSSVTLALPPIPDTNAAVCAGQPAPGLSALARNSVLPDVMT